MIILVASIIVSVALFLSVRSYEERGAVQAIRQAIEQRFDMTDAVPVSKATDIEALWSAYQPQTELTEADFYRLADPIIVSYRTSLPFLIALLVGGLTLVTLSLAMHMRRQAGGYQKIIADQEAALKQSQEKLASMMIVDELTGLSNGQHFNEVLTMECGRAVREFNPLTLMLIAIDSVSEPSLEDDFNDQQVCRITQVLERVISRPGDRVARIGASRFALILPATNEQSPMLANRLCEEVQKIELAGQRLSISIGISTMQPSASLNAENILAQTQAALTEALQNGSGQIRASIQGTQEVPLIISN
ncbi:GGDEF domain-containing protein [Amphritea sp. 1_MG-2023]|uniref:GGDEF domain-containing protein n=1 Tax=Amphritea sp. 1_MG-2023 TaxID=3062670 RepID=UPI0026E1C557|nr:GGDEF domain-containing protein [Amphritea sp. 1_MG-2023]